MRINLSSLYAGPLGSWGPGICDVPDEIAKGLIEAAVAIPVAVEIRDKSVAPAPKGKGKAVENKSSVVSDV